jgi:ketosteroid isomerase-like protein
LPILFGSSQQIKGPVTAEDGWMDKILGGHNCIRLGFVGMPRVWMQPRVNLSYYSLRNCYFCSTEPILFRDSETDECVLRVPRSLRRNAALLVCAAAVVVTVLSLRVYSAPAANADDAQVVESVRDFYAALTTDDLQRFHSVVTPDFYAFDGAKRFDADALMSLIKTLHQSGNVYVWTVNDPEAHISGNFAWITYVNRGSVTNASGMRNRTWLESAVLEKSDRWRIRFFHSTPVP